MMNMKSVPAWQNQIDQCWLAIYNIDKTKMTQTEEQWSGEGYNTWGSIKKNESLHMRNPDVSEAFCSWQ